jgi:5-methylcytosine-specific restriction protein A
MNIIKKGMKRYICKYPGCSNLIESSGYCEKHKTKNRKPFESAIRFNEALYNTTKWRQLRKEILNEQTNCFKCGLSKNETKLEVHHIIPPRGNEELFFDKNNLVAVCSNCHKIITNYETRNKDVHF